MKADITAHFTFSYYHCYLFFIFFSNQTHMHFPLNFTSRTITFAAGVMMNYGLLNMRPHVDCILGEGRKAYMCITLRGKCVNICVNVRHTRDMGGTA